MIFQIKNLVLLDTQTSLPSIKHFSEITQKNSKIVNYLGVRRMSWEVSFDKFGWFLKLYWEYTSVVMYKISFRFIV